MPRGGEAPGSTPAARVSPEASGGTLVGLDPLHAVSRLPSFSRSCSAASTGTAGATPLAQRLPPQGCDTHVSLAPSPAFADTLPVSGAVPLAPGQNLPQSFPSALHEQVPPQAPMPLAGIRTGSPQHPAPLAGTLASSVLMSALMGRGAPSGEASLRSVTTAASLPDAEAGAGGADPHGSATSLHAQPFEGGAVPYDSDGDASTRRDNPEARKGKATKEVGEAPPSDT